jgi:hypothetical protein
MAKVYRSVLGVSWVLGVISLVAALVLRIAPALIDKLRVSPHGGVMLAAVLFLCVLATGEARKSPPSS